MPGTDRVAGRVHHHTNCRPSHPDEHGSLPRSPGPPEGPPRVSDLRAGEHAGQGQSPGTAGAASGPCETVPGTPLAIFPEVSRVDSLRPLPKSGSEVRDSPDEGPAEHSGDGGAPQPGRSQLEDIWCRHRREQHFSGGRDCPRMSRTVLCTRIGEVRAAAAVLRALPCRGSQRLRVGVKHHGLLRSSRNTPS